MAIVNYSGFQKEYVEKVTFTYADLTSGSAVPLLNLPANAFVLDILLRINTAWNSQTSDAIIIQNNEGTPKEFINITAGSGALSAGLVSKAATGATTNLGYVNPVSSTIDAKWTKVGNAPTTGTATLIVTYLVDDRKNFYQEY